MLTKKLLSQAIPQDAALDAEVDVRQCILRHIKQPVPDADLRVLRTEAQGRPLFHRHSPDQFTPLATITASYSAARIFRP